jgi:hypothetical protein
VKRTPIRRAERHTIWHVRNKLSGFMTSVKSSGMPMGLVTSRQAPSSETLRTTQSIPAARLKEIVPDFNVRDRGVARCLFTTVTTNQLKAYGTP